jgi:hypothetical protein
MFSAVAGKGLATRLSPTITHRFACSTAEVSSGPAGFALQPHTENETTAISNM